MKHVKLFESYHQEQREIGYNTLHDIFKTIKRINNSYLDDYSVLFDEWAIRNKGYFALNAFEIDDTRFSEVFDIKEIRKYVEKLKDLGATVIKVGGFVLEKGNYLYEDASCDTLYFKIDKKGYDKAIEIIPEPNEHDFNYINGFTRFWWD